MKDQPPFPFNSWERALPQRVIRSIGDQLSSTCLFPFCWVAARDWDVDVLKWKILEHQILVRRQKGGVVFLLLLLPLLPSRRIQIGHWTWWGWWRIGPWHLRPLL